MKLQISNLSLAFLLICSIPQTVSDQKHLEVTQPEKVKAEAGESATITCTFMTTSPSYSATWSLGCDDTATLQNQPCYRRRVNISTTDPVVQTPQSPQIPVYEMKTTVTITNLTENDSEKFCCHISTTIGEKGTGPGTRLEVTPKSSAGQQKQDTPLITYILYAVIGAEACVIIILIAVVIKNRPGGSSRSEHQGQKLDPSGLQYAEICKKSFPQHSRPRKDMEAVTYSAVKVKKEEHRANQEYELY
ncbi:uncharacterized protein LOC142660041 [Rhinoderma darwinii]|uniref:uncharacterized protein LOC142660041 n=1 Tax=Rhinoderma darwinii TaxID=43563 RepID=UPI003F66BD6A